MESSYRENCDGTMFYPLSVPRCVTIVLARGYKFICEGTLASTLSIQVRIRKTAEEPDEVRRGHKDITEVQFWRSRPKREGLRRIDPFASDRNTLQHERESGDKEEN